MQAKCQFVIPVRRHASVSSKQDHCVRTQVPVSGYFLGIGDHIWADRRHIATDDIRGCMYFGESRLQEIAMTRT